METPLFSIAKIKDPDSYKVEIDPALVSLDKNTQYKLGITFGINVEYKEPVREGVSYKESLSSTPEGKVANTLETLLIMLGNFQNGKMFVHGHYLTRGVVLYHRSVNFDWAAVIPDPGVDLEKAIQAQRGEHCYLSKKNPVVADELRKADSDTLRNVIVPAHEVSHGVTEERREYLIKKFAIWSDFGYQEDVVNVFGNYGLYFTLSPKSVGAACNPFTSTRFFYDIEAVGLTPKDHVEVRTISMVSHQGQIAQVHFDTLLSKEARAIIVTTPKRLEEYHYKGISLYVPFRPTERRIL